jgi:hypothetical protein
VLLQAFDCANNNIVLSANHEKEFAGGNGPWIVGEVEKELDSYRLVNTRWEDHWDYNTGVRKIRAIHKEYYATAKEIDEVFRLYTIGSKEYIRKETTNDGE